MVIIEQVEKYLWIEKDERLESILANVNQLLVNYIGDYTEWQKTIQVKNVMIKDNLLPLLHTKVSDIVSINWNDFTEKVPWIDYLIITDWAAKVKNLNDYISNDFGVFEVVYYVSFWEIESWYLDNTPDDIIGAVSDLVWFYYGREDWKDVKSYNLWPRSVSFWDVEEKTKIKEFKSRLLHYIPLHLRIW